MILQFFFKKKILSSFLLAQMNISQTLQNQNIERMYLIDLDANFMEKSHKILSTLSEKLLIEDKQQILSFSSNTKIQNTNNIEAKTENGKKLFHIDLKRHQIYWEIRSHNTRMIKKQSMLTKECLQYWKFQDKNLGPQKIIEALGKHNYTQLKNRFFMKDQTLQTIHFNAMNNAYSNFNDFLISLTDLINQKIIEIFDGRILKYFHVGADKNKTHQKIWQYCSYELTRIWKSFWYHIKNQKIEEKYNKALQNDLNQLFGKNQEYCCSEGLTMKPSQQKKLNYSYLQKTYLQEDKPKINYSQSHQWDINPIEISLFSDLDVTKSITSQQYEQFPFPQNYPLTDTYDLQFSRDKDKIQYFRKSFKRPAQNLCDENCVCLKEDGHSCANIQRKIQCDRHSCNNSQIRDKKDLLCWYLDQSKNWEYLYTFQQKLKDGQQLTQYHSFGLDFYTVSILFFLLPFNRIQYGQIKRNNTQKKQIIENLIPYELSKTQNLFEAIKNIAGNRQYEKYHYEAKALEKKIQMIRMINLQNLQCKLDSKTTKMPNVKQLKGYYKGLGVMSTGLIIPKGRLIGKFVGQILPPWRQQEKQIVSTKFNNEQKYYDNQIKFYCITVQTHYDDDKNEPKCFSVDPQNKGNFCRSLNHCCNPNCRVQIMVSDGKYFLGVYSIRQIKQNQELTFDYMSVTDNYEEYLKSICLCSSTSCRGRYLKHQDEIHASLDLDFLENQQPIIKRLKKLIVCCTYPEQKMIVVVQDKKIKQTLNNRQICYKSIPKNVKSWIMYWINQLNCLIESETKYLNNKLKKSNQKIDSKVQQSNRIQKKILQKQKLAILNAKILKIAQLFTKTKDFSAPFQLQLHQKLIQHLESYLNKEVKKTNNSKQKKTQQIIQKIDLQSRIKKVRYGLFNKAKDEMQKNKKIQQVHFYLQKAFTMNLVKIHKYRDYQSDPIKIWMQNSGKLESAVQFHGKNLYMIQNLVAWAGEFNRIYKNKQNQSKQPQLQKSFLEDYQGKLEGQMNPIFKKKYLMSKIQLAINEIEEQKFNLKKPNVVKNKKFFKQPVNWAEIKQNLDSWIKKQIYQEVTRFKIDNKSVSSSKGNQYSFSGSKREQISMNKRQIQNLQQSSNKSCKKSSKSPKKLNQTMKQIRSSTKQTKQDKRKKKSHK